jgi:hypothetical protein
VDDVLVFQLAQPLREHAVRDVRDRGSKLGISGGALQEDLDDRAGPAATDQLDRLVKPRAESCRAHDPL